MHILLYLLKFELSLIPLPLHFVLTWIGMFYMSLVWPYNSTSTSAGSKIHVNFTVIPVDKIWKYCLYQTLRIHKIFVFNLCVLKAGNWRTAPDELDILKLADLIVTECLILLELISKTRHCASNNSTYRMWSQVGFAYCRSKWKLLYTRICLGFRGLRHEPLRGWHSCDRTGRQLGSFISAPGVRIDSIDDLFTRSFWTGWEQFAERQR